MKKAKVVFSVILIATLMITCGAYKAGSPDLSGEAPATAAESEETGDPEETEETEEPEETTQTSEPEETTAPAGNTGTSDKPVPTATPAPEWKKGKDIVILSTSDVHCSPEKGFGYAGLYRIREKFKKEGCEVLLVDDGDQIEGHGELFGTLTQGEQVIDLMNKMGYDVAIPGNHEFSYGPDKFIQLTKKANFPYISCNIFKNGKRLFKPYIIKEVDGKKIAFVGAITPRTIGVYQSRSLFLDSNNKIIYDFMNGEKGNRLNRVIQTNVDSARKEGADLVFLMAHIGQARKYQDYEQITYVISHTKGIDGVFDGHSHDAKRFVVNNAEGRPVTRIAMGHKFSRIGYARISGEDGSIKMGIFAWTSSVNATELFGIKNEMSEEVDKALKEYNERLYGKQGSSSFPLLITNPSKKDSNGNPIKVINRGETNLGDFAADALRNATGADVAIIPADKFNKSIPAGDISLYNLRLAVPSAKRVTVVKATGQQILDALEWGTRKYPKTCDAFPQVSGVTFTVNTKQSHKCKSKNGYFTRVDGKYRVSNVKIGGKPIQLKKKYTVVSYFRVVRTSEYGYTMFKKCKRVKIDGRLGYDMLASYLRSNQKGVISSKYKNPGGQKRITFI